MARIVRARMVRLDYDVAKMLDRESEEQHISRNRIINLTLRKVLARKEDKVDRTINDVLENALEKMMVEERV